MQYQRRGSQIYVMVFRTYRREAVIVTTTRLPTGLILSRVMVDNHTWPSVSLGPCSVVSGFPAKRPDIPPGVTGSDVTPPRAISHLNFHIKADPHLDPRLSLGRRRSRWNILKTSMTPLDFTASHLVSL